MPQLREVNPNDLSTMQIHGVRGDSLRAEVQGRTNKHKVAVRLSDGACACNCEHFQHRCKHGYPTIYSGKVCRHIEAFRERLQMELADRQEPPAEWHP